MLNVASVASDEHEPRTCSQFTVHRIVWDFHQYFLIDVSLEFILFMNYENMIMQSCSISWSRFAGEGKPRLPGGFPGVPGVPGAAQVVGRESVSDS